MATSAAPSAAGEVVQAWVSPDLARELRRQAAIERRSVSSVIRLAVEDRLASRAGANIPSEAHRAEATQ